MKKLTEKKQAFTEQAVREAIGQAALHVLGAQGLEKLTMQKVAAEADIATGTLYNYFRDKDALLIYIAEQLFSQIRERMRRALEENSNARVKLLEMIRCPFQFFKENLSYFQLMDRADVYSKMHTSIKENHVMEERRMIARLLEEGMQQGIFRKVDIEKTADLLQRCVVGTICVKSEVEVFNPDKEAQWLAEMFYAFLE